MSSDTPALTENITDADVESYWAPSVHRETEEQHWSATQVDDRLNIAEWSEFLSTLPRDPYVNSRWKRMSWVHLLENGDVECMGECPMAQGGMFNDAESMADKLRYYPSLETAFTAREDFKSFVRGWADLWGIGAHEPILVQLNGVKGTGHLDPLQGQGIHADGCKFLSVLVIKRENVTGATNHLYADKAGKNCLADIQLAPGDILHIHDDKLFHSAAAMTQTDPTQPFERFILIINSRFVDGFQNRMLRRHFPEAVLNDVF
ncbi:2OG-Fe dioxygenase family protein [Halomonas sp. M20]|uniref:2OG-Fe dioxygenase family protein n=1 Tax=Halomonas sp. M20 TaxID=2763264 RepID=UPI001D0B3D06|nr:2OG-Fe dioxygenase family protein [Halomonas sp. M20]